MWDNRVNSNLRLNRSEFHVFLRTRGGLSLAALSRNKALNSFRVAPDICFILIGEN